MKSSDLDIGRVNDTIRVSGRKLTRELEDVIKLVERSSANPKSKSLVLRGLAEVLESFRRVGELRGVEVPAPPVGKVGNRRNQSRVSHRVLKDKRHADPKAESQDRTRFREETEQEIEQDE